MTSHVILDEIHERDVLSDFLMIIVRDLALARPDLKIILMSATLNAQQFASYFSKQCCCCTNQMNFCYYKCLLGHELIFVIDPSPAVDGQFIVWSRVDWVTL